MLWTNEPNVNDGQKERIQNMNEDANIACK